MGGFASVVRGALAGLNESAGNPQVAQQLEQRNQQEQQAKQAQMRAQVTPHALAIKGLQTKLQSLDPNDPHYHDEQALLTNEIARNLHEVRGILYPDKDPTGKGNFFERGITDKLHMTSIKRRQDSEKAKQAKGEAQDESGAQALTTAAPSYTQTPQFQQSKKLEEIRGQQQQALEDARAKSALDVATAKQDAKPAVIKEVGGVPVVESGGKTYFPPDANKPDTPPEVKEALTTMQSALTKKEAEKAAQEAQRQKDFEQNQARLMANFGRSMSQQGTWQVAEGENGETKLLNSKTGEMKDAPAGLHKSGFYAKQVAPLEAANMNITSYLDGKVYDGPGDLTLQHEFFTATQPSTGFRMTKVQQDILQNSQNWLNSVQASVYHKLHGTWFSDEQRRQIADAAQSAIESKKKSLNVGPKTGQLQDSRDTQKSGGIKITRDANGRITGIE